MKKLLISIVLVFMFAMNLTPNNSLSYCVERNNKITNNLLAENELNMKVQLILKTIRIIESGENYDCVGKSKEYGAYQFTQSTWRLYSNRYYGEILDIKLKENQDMVSEQKIRNLIEMGFELDEIASFWNSGRRTYRNNRGVNSFGVNYNVPQYVNKFLVVYEKLCEDNKTHNSIIFCNLSEIFAYNK